MVESMSAVCHTTNARGDTPITTTWPARQAIEITISAKWKRSAVEASRSRSTWCTTWNRHRNGTRWVSTCQT